MAKDNKNMILPIAAVIIVVVAVASIVVPKLTKSSSEGESTVQSTTIGSAQIFTDDIVIEESTITEKASFYDYDADGTTVEIFAVKALDGTVRIALNTCQVCKGSPYAYFVQSGDSFIYGAKL